MNDTELGIGLKIDFDGRSSVFAEATFDFNGRTVRGTWTSDNGYEVRDVKEFEGWEDEDIGKFYDALDEAPIPKLLLEK